jgi:hypothetical protein
MRRAIGASALVALLAIGCQQSTSTGPATPPTGTAQRPTTTSPAVNSSAVKKLTVTAAKDQSIDQGESDKVLVTINRDNFDDPVTIRLNDLPVGVECTNNSVVIPAGSNSATLTLKAAADAPVGEHNVTIAAEAPGLDLNTQTFVLKVKKEG